MNYDHIDQILKSITPTQFKYSKKSKELDKVFKYVSLDNLVKSLDLRFIYKDPFTPDPDNTLHKNDYGVNFKNSYNYLNEFSDINNLPIVIQSKNCIKSGENDPNFESESKRDEEEFKKISIKQRINREKERIRLRIKRLKNFRENMFSLDPGKYCPNYNAIKKRTPCVRMGEAPKNDDRDGWLQLNKNYSCDNIKKDKKEESNKKYKNDDFLVNLSNVDISERRNSIIMDKNLSDSLIEFNKELHKNDNNNSFSKEKINMEKKFSKFINNLSLPVIDSNTNKFKGKNIKRKRMKNSFSIGNLNIIRHNSPILFNKMTGRKQNLFSNDNNNSLSYSPKYDSTRPHITSTIFKYHNNFQGYKKYKLNKFIRGYKVSSDYYVMVLGREKYGKKCK